MSLTLVLTACSGEQEAPGASPQPTPSATSIPAPTPSSAAWTTEVGVGRVAGRLGSRKRQEVKTSITAVVDGYLDGAFVAGPWPRQDFSASFTGFRRGAARDAAERDLDMVTNHDIGADLTAVTVTKRRLRLDVLSPRGRPAAATAGFVLGLQTTAGSGATPVAQRVAGRLFLTRQRGVWKVFGYDVDKTADKAVDESAAPGGTA